MSKSDDVLYTLIAQTGLADTSKFKVYVKATLLWW